MSTRTPGSRALLVGVHVRKGQGAHYTVVPKFVVPGTKRGLPFPALRAHEPLTTLPCWLESMHAAHAFSTHAEGSLVRTLCHQVLIITSHWCLGSLAHTPTCQPVPIRPPPAPALMRAVQTTCAADTTSRCTGSTAGEVPFTYNCSLPSTSTQLVTALYFEVRVRRGVLLAAPLAHAAMGSRKVRCSLQASPGMLATRSNAGCDCC